MIPNFKQWSTEHRLRQPST